MHRLPSDEVLPFLLMVATLLLAARLMGELFRKLKLPQVMGELVAGILLGPSCLERCAPGFYESFFASPENAGVAYDGLARIGILLLLFVAGMEINLKTIQKKANAAAAISLSGVAFPFLIGFVASWYLSSYLFPQGMGDKLASSLFMGTALSITALSVLAKILIDIDK
ncbi:MAG TPA: cation:proton antiporter, partial [Chitinophagales bacterium]|nr:cation:proton antiporter [Chitinophagales bacterium]